jgi:hypothetical protein
MQSPSHRSANLRSTTGPALAANMSTSTEAIEIAARAKLQDLPADDIEFRLLDALLTNAPTPEGVAVIAADIISASEEPNGLTQLATFYKTGLLLPSKSSSVSEGSI